MNNLTNIEIKTSIPLKGDHQLDDNIRGLTVVKIQLLDSSVIMSLNNGEYLVASVGDSDFMYFQLLTKEQLPYENGL